MSDLGQPQGEAADGGVVDGIEADRSQLQTAGVAQVAEQFVQSGLVGADGVRAEPAGSGRYTVSQARTKPKKSSDAMTRLRQDRLDAAVGEGAQVGVEVGGEMEVVPGVLGVGVP